MAIADNYDIDPGQNNKAPPLGAPEGAFPRKQISDTFRTLMAAVKEVAVEAGGVVAATETTPGIIQLATDAEVQTGTDDERAVTASSLRACTATDTRKGVVELATSAEAAAGTDTTRAVTPAGLAGRTPAASETIAGIMEIATAAEVQTGTDNTRAVTPAGLDNRNASESLRGIIEIANAAEVLSGTDNTRALTPARIAGTITKANPGAILHPGGMIERFGFSTTQAGGTRTITYGTAFPTIVLWVNVQYVGLNNYLGRPSSSTTADFTAQLFTLAGATAPSGETFFWRAIGY